MQEWIYRFGVPEILITDNGTNLTSQEFELFLEQLGIEHRKTTPYHAQSDGQTERFNGFLGTTLSIYSKSESKEWTECLDEVLFAYNSTPHRTTKYSPFYLAHGIEARCPWQSKLRLAPVLNELSSTKQRKKTLAEHREEAKSNIIKAQQISKTYYDRKRKKPNFNVGDLVLISQPILKKGTSKKFNDRFKGPYKIRQKFSDINYELINLNGPVKLEHCHVNRMLPFFETINDYKEIESTVNQNNRDPESSSPSHSDVPDDELMDLFNDY